MKLTIDGRIFSKGEFEDYLRTVLYYRRLLAPGIINLPTKVQERIRQYIRSGPRATELEFESVHVRWWKNPDCPFKEDKLSPVFEFLFTDGTVDTVSYRKFLLSHTTVDRIGKLEQRRSEAHDQLTAVRRSGETVDHVWPRTFQALSDSYDQDTEGLSWADYHRRHAVLESVPMVENLRRRTQHV